MQKTILILFTLGCSIICHSQSATDSSTGRSDSTEFKLIQQKLLGCWKTRHYQFKYQINLGSEFKSHVHSSAPIFKLIMKNDDIYLEWIELTGGEHLQKITSIKKKKLTVENEEQITVVYKRNKDCSSLFKGIK